MTASIFHKAYFDIGLCLVSEHNPFSHSVVVGLWFPVGSRFEKSGEHGAYHVIEHLVFKSAQAMRLVKQIESVGGDVNAFTAHEHTCYHITCLKHDIGLALKFLACVRSKLEVSASDFKKEKAVILQEIRSHNDDIEDEVHRFFMSHVLAGSSLAHSISGEIRDVEGLSLTQLKKLHADSYANSKCVISVAGNFDRKKLTLMIQKEFRCQERKPIKKFRLKNEVNSSFERYYQDEFHHAVKDGNRHFKPGVYLKDRKTQQLYFTMSFPLKPIFSDERFPASLLNSWFGQGMASHLFQKLREDLGLVYFVHSHISTFLDQGLFLIEASCETQNMPEVVEIIFSEVKKLHNKRFTNSLLLAQKKLLRGQVLLGAEDLENRMQSLALNELIFQEYRCPVAYLKKFESVTTKDVHNFIRERLQFRNCAVLLYGQKAKEFKPFIDQLLEGLL